MSLSQLTVNKGRSAHNPADEDGTPREIRPRPPRSRSRRPQVARTAARTSTHLQATGEAASPRRPPKGEVAAFIKIVTGLRESTKALRDQIQGLVDEAQQATVP